MEKFNKICMRCIHECKQSAQATLICCPKFESPESVTWNCHRCKTKNEVEYATDRHTIICPACRAIHAVTGLHTHGAPILRLCAKKEG